MRSTVSFSIVAIVLGLGVLGCGDASQSQATTATFSDAPAVTQNPTGEGVVMLGESDGVRVRIFHSREFGHQESKVLPAFENFVNSGQYQIVAVRTVYDRGRMVRAEVYYRTRVSADSVRTK